MKSPSNSLKKIQHSQAVSPQPATKFERMVESRIWTNRLERVLQDRLGEVKIGLNKIITNLERVASALDADSQERAMVDDLRGYTDSIYRNIYPDVVELNVRMADNCFSLDSQVLELSQRLASAEAAVAKLQFELDCTRGSRSYKAATLIRSLYRRVFSSGAAQAVASASVHSERGVEEEQVAEELTRIESPALQGRFPYEELVEHGPTQEFSNYENVDNTGTAFELFDNWKAVYHWEGKRYGSRKPILSDHLEHLLELHQILSFKNKRVLELGPFEGANTKQIVDLGAHSLTCIEANKEFYLKCLLLKNCFHWDNVEVLYGDCMSVLAAPEFKKRPWFDICYASGILYHMKDPLHFIDLITQTAPTIYIWSQYASEDAPRGPWTELKDGEDRFYEARWNSYDESEHWGGVASGAFWLTKDAMLKAFEDRGFRTHQVKLEQNNIGKVISFVAQRDDVAL